MISGSKSSNFKCLSSGTLFDTPPLTPISTRKVSNMCLNLSSLSFSSFKRNLEVAKCIDTGGRAEYSVKQQDKGLEIISHALNTGDPSNGCCTAVLPYLSTAAWIADSTSLITKHLRGRNAKYVLSTTTDR